jgi:nitrite reductase (NADH) small subunit
MDVTLGPIVAIPEGEGRTFSVGAERIAVFHSRDGSLYATQANCPHRGGPLADGLLGNGMLICPLHSLKFDLRTGVAQNSDCTLKTYPTRLNASGQIVITMTDAKQLAP